MIDRKKLAYIESPFKVLVNLLCHRVDDEEELYERVTRSLAYHLEKFPLTIASELRGPFEHEQEGSENVLFFEAGLASPNGQCFEAKEYLSFVEWWN